MIVRMRIGGFQKLTLLDYPGEMACIVFAAGCDLRCPFCHNSGLLAGEAAVDEEEVFEYLKKRSGVLDGVVLTGGEPLMQEGVFAFAERVRGMGYKLKIDTNGTYPERLREMIERGLVDYAAMDVKHVPEKYSLAAGVSADTEKIKESIEIIKAADIRREFRTTVVKGIHESDDIVAAARLLSTDVPYYIQSYRESEGVLMPEGLGAFSEEELKDAVRRASEFCANVRFRG